MSFSKIARFAGAVAFASKVAAHGHVTGIVADGVYYEGYSTNFQYMTNPPVTVGWSIPEDESNGFIAPDAYATPDIICHLNATNAKTSATVAAGGSVNLQWTAWPESHHGPVIDYLANCNGDCATVDKTTLEFFKIDGVGLIDDTTVPGTWASDQLIANNNSWTVTIPPTIAAGNYVLRHEIIALHSAGTVNGAQNYPQCVNLQITGSGTDTPTGTLGEALYQETDPGIEINIYTTIATYTVPGPALYTGAVTAVESGGATITSTAPVGTTVPAAADGTTATSAAAAVTTAASSSPVVASSAAAAVTPVSSSPVFTNGTASGAAAQGTGTSRSCKKKSKTSSAAAVPTSALNVAAVPTTTASEVLATPTASAVADQTSTTSSSKATATPTKSSSGTTPSSPAASSTTAADVTMPSGTTLGNLLSWLSSFYESHKDTTYSGSTVARRHARDVVASRDIDEEITNYRKYY